MSVEISKFLDTDVLKKGLPRRQDQRMFLETAEELLNVRCTEYGLDSYSEITQLYNTDLYDNYGISVNFPFPQLFEMKNGSVYLLNDSKLYSVNMSTLSATNVDLTELSLYDIQSVNTPKLPVRGTQWSLIDFENTWMFVNGQSTILKPNIDASGKVFVENSISINTGCYHNGRSVLGGFNSSNFWNLEWRLFWEEWSSKNDYEVALDTALGSNYVMWSSALGGDVFMLFYPSLMKSGLISTGGYDISDPLILDILKTNDAGFMPMSWRGSVLSVKPIDRDWETA